MKRMTNEVGMIEHATYTEPNLDEGYSVDDNARAFRVALTFGDELSHERKVYLSFLQKAVTDHGFYNDMDKNETWAGKPGFGEWFGREMLAASEGIKRGDRSEREVCERIWGLGIRSVPDGGSLRMNAQLAIAGEKSRAKFLVEALRKNREDDWIWFEPVVSYDNGRLPYALFVSGYVDEARQTLDFLLENLWDKEHDCFSFVGNANWWEKRKEKAIFDQQPIEAGNIIETCVGAFKITRDSKYLEWAEKAWDWYFGRNIIREKVWDEKTGGVRDGLRENSCNLNEGAEAVLSFVLAGVALGEVS